MIIDPASVIVGTTGAVVWMELMVVMTIPIVIVVTAAAVMSAAARRRRRTADRAFRAAVSAGRPPTTSVESRDGTVVSDHVITSPQPSTAPPPPAAPVDRPTEIVGIAGRADERALRQAIAELREERDILLYAVAYFADQSQRVAASGPAPVRRGRDPREQVTAPRLPVIGRADDGPPVATRRVVRLGSRGRPWLRDGTPRTDPLPHVSARAG
jgi:hypothetical protein